MASSHTSSCPAKTRHSPSIAGSTTFAKSRSATTSSKPSRLTACQSQSPAKPTLTDIMTQISTVAIHPTTVKSKSLPPSPLTIPIRVCVPCLALLINTPEFSDPSAHFRCIGPSTTPRLPFVLNTGCSQPHRISSSVPAQNIRFRCASLDSPHIGCFADC